MIGTHGTCGANAETIDSNGFHPSKGWRGTGVYFWEADPLDTEEAIELAGLWWSHKFGSGQCAEENEDCVIFLADIDSDVNSINFHDRSQKRAFNQFARKLQETTNGGLSDKEKCHIFDMFIDSAEKQKQVKISIVKTVDKTPASKATKNSICRLHDAHRCVIVRDVRCISTYRRVRRRNK